MNRTFNENSSLIRNMVKLEDYFAFNNIKKIGNRYECPFCKGIHLSIYKATNGIERAQCFSKGCIHGDIIDFHSKLKNINHIESLNDLISIFSIKRVMPSNINTIKPVENDLLFKENALKHLSLILDELDKIFFLECEKLIETNSLEICHELRQKLNEKILELKYNKYNKDELRNLYKISKQLINLIKER